MYIFGYGSLIWRPDFKYQSSVIGTVHGFERRFWQASHDHRGTPQRPGRVVTLVPVTGGSSAGVLYELDDRTADATLMALDEREQDGYERVSVPVALHHGAERQAITWIAKESNPSWRGGETIHRVAGVIKASSGPSGSNIEYLQKLHDALTRLEVHDGHISDLLALVVDTQ